MASKDVSTESEIAPIERSTLHDVVVTRLRDMIIEGQLLAGNRVHEGDLCQQLGISRTPLREALKVLAMEGLVELNPGRGATVRKLTAKDIQDMLSVLSVLENLAGRLTCQMATDEDIREVRRLHDEMLSFYAAGDSLPYFKRNQQIHSLLITLSGNESLALVHDLLQTRLNRPQAPVYNLLLQGKVVDYGSVSNATRHAARVALYK